MVPVRAVLKLWRVMYRILIVDDNRPFVLAISESLHFRGYHVTSASDGSSALTLVESEVPDLILLDIEMPGMDGLHFCTALRQNPRFRSIPVIFMSVRSDLTDKLAAYEAGADDYMVKPFEPRELALRIEALLRAARRYHAPVIACDEITLYPNSGTACVNGETVSLTPVEFDLLSFLIKHRGQVVPARTLLTEVHTWSLEMIPKDVTYSSAVRSQCGGYSCWK